MGKQVPVSQYQHVHGIFHAKMLAASRDQRNLTQNQTMSTFAPMPITPLESKPFVVTGKKVIQKPGNMLTILSLKKAALKPRVPMKTTVLHNDLVPIINKMPTNIKLENHAKLYAPPKKPSNMPMPISPILGKALAAKQKTVFSQKEGTHTLFTNVPIRNKSAGIPLRPFRSSHEPEIAVTAPLNKGIYAENSRIDQEGEAMSVLHPNKASAFKGMLPPSQGIPDKKVLIDQNALNPQETSGPPDEKHHNLLLRKSLTEKPSGQKVFPLNTRVVLNKKIMATLEESVPIDQMTSESSENITSVTPQEVAQAHPDNGDPSGDPIVEDVTSVMKSGVSYENGSSSSDAKSSTAAVPENTENTSAATENAPVMLGEESLPAVSGPGAPENTSAASGVEAIPTSNEGWINQVSQSENNLPPAAPPIPSSEDASAHTGPKGEQIRIKSPNRLSLENTPLMSFKDPGLESSAPLWGEGDKGITIYNNNSVSIGGIHTSTNTSATNRFQPAIRGPSNAVWSGFGYTRSNVTTNSTVYDPKYGNRTNGRGELRRPHIVQWHALPSFPDGPIISRGGVECPCPYLMPYRECQLRCLKGKKVKSSSPPLDHKNSTSSKVVDEQVMKMLHPLVG